MFTRVVKGEVTVPLWPDQAPGAPPAFPNNAAYLQNDFATLLTQAFPHLDVATIQAFVLGATPSTPLPLSPVVSRLEDCVGAHLFARVSGLFSESALAPFKIHLRDFVVRMKEFENTVRPSH